MAAEAAVAALTTAAVLDFFGSRVLVELLLAFEHFDLLVELLDQRSQFGNRFLGSDGLRAETEESGGYQCRWDGFGSDFHQGLFLRAKPPVVRSVLDNW